MSSLGQKRPMTRKIRYIEANNGTIVPTVSGTLFTKGQRNILQQYANQYNKNHPTEQHDVEEESALSAPSAPPFWKGWTGETKSLFNPISPRKKRTRKNRRTTRKTRKNRNL